LKPAAAIYRLGRKPNPWAAPDWALAGPDGTFGNRFDDPGATYRVLYASSQRLGCFLETLARFRIDLKLAAELAEIQGDADHLPQGEVPVEWLANRIMGVATARGEYADVGGSAWISRLRIALMRDLQELGIDSFDASILQKTAPRSLTQRVSRIAFGDDLAGIRYLSKHGHDIENWALFEPFQILPLEAQQLRRDDHDLGRALQLYSLKFRV